MEYHHNRIYTSLVAQEYACNCRTCKILRSENKLSVQANICLRVKTEILLL